jgi:hypothetical protein
MDEGGEAGRSSAETGGAGGGTAGVAQGGNDASGTGGGVVGVGGNAGTDASGTGGALGGSAGSTAGTGGSTSAGGVGGASGGVGGASGGVGGAGGSGGALDCDQDDDDSLASSAACGGDDCDDLDADVHPGQSGFFTEPNRDGGYDYDCDGVEEPEVSNALDCSLLSISNCDAQGYSSPLPACGDPGAWIRCAPTLPTLSVLCLATDQGSRTMGCR